MNRLPSCKVSGLVLLALFGFIAALILIPEGEARADVPGIETTSHGVVVSSTLPHCANEDGSGYDQTFPCTWNVGSPKDGNGRGLAYVLTNDYDYRHSIDFVWAYSPVHNGWHWERTGHGPSDCVVKAGKAVEKCADGRHAA